VTINTTRINLFIYLREFTLETKFLRNLVWYQGKFPYENSVSLIVQGSKPEWV